MTIDMWALLIAGIAFGFAVGSLVMMLIFTRVHRG